MPYCAFFLLSWFKVSCLAKAQGFGKGELGDSCSLEQMSTTVDWILNQAVTQKDACELPIFDVS